MTGWDRRRARVGRGVSEAEALRRARELCDREGLPWKEPVRVRQRRSRWVVWTNADKIGGNVEILVDAKTGEARRRWGPVSR